MPRLRLLPPQFLLPAWNVQQWRQIRRSHSWKTRPPAPDNPSSPPSPPSSPSPPSPPSPPSSPHLSLLEELFPEEAQNLRAFHDQKTTQTERLIPPLPLSPDPDDVSILGSKRSGSTRLHKVRKNGRIGNLPADAQQRKEMTVMVLRYASKSLCEDDFRRIVPKGKHIEGWKGQGDILKVIPLRDPHTLHPIGHYLLLFHSLLSAKTYQQQLVHLHHSARTHTPTSVESPLPPPPGYESSNGEDVYQQLQDYALIPPSQRLSLRFLLEPYSPNITSLLNRGGYEGIVQDTSPSTGTGLGTDSVETTEGKEANEKAAVLFWTEGLQPTTFSLRQTIDRDGRDRGLPWAIASASASTSTSTASSTGITKLAHPASTMSYADNPKLNTSINEDESQLQAPTKRSTDRWVITFDSEVEARRFIRAWHRRPFPVVHRDGKERAMEGSGEVLAWANVEFLW